MTCIVLVPNNGRIESATNDALDELERRSFVIRRVSGYAAIDVARNEIASQALVDGFDETIWIDSDIAFHPDDIERLRDHGIPLICGIYPKKGRRELACNVLPGTESITFGTNGGLTELLYAATGFLYVRKCVYEDIQQKLNLPTCNQMFGDKVVSWFQPLIIDTPQGPRYLPEDYAFCERAREAGYSIMADTRIRLFHIGSYHYSWEDAGRTVDRFDDFVFHLR